MEEQNQGIDQEKEVKNTSKKIKKSIINAVREDVVVDENKNENKKIENIICASETKTGVAKHVLGIVWLVINVVALAFFASYSNKVADLFIALSLPLNMVMIVLCFSRSDLEVYDDFIK